MKGQRDEKHGFTMYFTPDASAWEFRLRMMFGYARFIFLERFCTKSWQSSSFLANRGILHKLKNQYRGKGCLELSFLFFVHFLSFSSSVTTVICSKISSFRDLLSTFKPLLSEIFERNFRIRSLKLSCRKFRYCEVNLNVAHLHMHELTPYCIFVIRKSS